MQVSVSTGDVPLVVQLDEDTEPFPPVLVTVIAVDQVIKVGSLVELEAGISP